MHQYGVRDVEKLLGLPRSTIRALIGAGFVTPQRGVRNAWLFSFQDLIVLRTAQALATAHIPHRRITRSLKELRRHLPDEMPLSGLRIGALAEHVVVTEGAAQWQAETGQYLLAFDGDPAAGSLSVMETPTRMQAKHRGALASESGESPTAPRDPDSAIDALTRTIAAEPARLEARINLGQLLHENGRHAEAERIYRQALEICGNDALLLYNFGVLLDDMDRKIEAMAAYQLALRGDPAMADCHYNLALLYEELEKPKDAIRHMSQYRRLVAGKPSR
jgi:tetratricopeptide (TPR) repeat protein